MIQPTLVQAVSQYIHAMSPRPKPSTEQMEASKAPVSPEGSERNVQQGGSRKEAGRILFGLAVLGAGLLASNRVRE